MTEGLVLDDKGDRYIKVVEAGDGTRHDHFIKEGDIVSINNILFTLNRYQKGAINIILKDDYIVLIHPFLENL